MNHTTHHSFREQDRSTRESKSEKEGGRESRSKKQRLSKDHETILYKNNNNNNIYIYIYIYIYIIYIYIYIYRERDITNLIVYMHALYKIYIHMHACF